MYRDAIASSSRHLDASGKAGQSSLVVNEWCGPESLTQAPNPDRTCKIFLHPAFQNVLMTSHLLLLVASKTQSLQVEHVVGLREIGETVDGFDVVRFQGRNRDATSALTKAMSAVKEHPRLEVHLTGRCKLSYWRISDSKSTSSR